MWTPTQLPSCSMYDAGQGHAFRAMLTGTANDRKQHHMQVHGCTSGCDWSMWLIYLSHTLPSSATFFK